PPRVPREVRGPPHRCRQCASRGRCYRSLARAQEFQNGLRRPRARTTAQVAVDPRELSFQGAAPFGIVKPYQELRSDRLGDYLVLKIFADDASIRKEICLRKEFGFHQIEEG